MIDFWFIIDNTLFVSSLEGGGQELDLPGADPLTVDVMSDGMEGVVNQFGLQFADVPGFTITNGYADLSYSEAVPIRENLIDMEDSLPGQFLVAGCWDFFTGEPVGGVGSPWFLSPPELLDFMPNGVYEDRILRLGQHERVFIT